MLLNKLSLTFFHTPQTRHFAKRNGASADEPVMNIHGENVTEKRATERGTQREKASNDAKICIDKTSLVHRGTFMHTPNEGRNRISAT